MPAPTTDSVCCGVVYSPLTGGDAGTTLASTGANTGLVGSLDEVAIYDHLLTTEQIGAHYLAAFTDAVDALNPETQARVHDPTSMIPYLTDLLGDDGQRAYAPERSTGNVYGDLALFFYFYDFNFFHAAAVASTADAASAVYPGCPLLADLGQFRTRFDPDGTLGGAYGLPGHGPNGGIARPDLVLRCQTPPTNHVYEVKFDSPYGAVAGPHQLAGYVGALTTQTGQPTYSGSPLPQRSTELSIGGMSFHLTVRSSTSRGLELYTVDGGAQRIAQLVMSQVRALVTPQEQVQGLATEQRHVVNGVIDILVSGHVRAVIYPVRVEEQYIIVI
jgi:hypothetical protein